MEQSGDAPRAIAAIVASQAHGPLTQCLFIVGPLGHLLLRRPTLPDHLTGPPLRHPEHGHDLHDRLPASGRAVRGMG